MDITTYYIFSSLVLALLLFYPASKLIFSIRVRRMEKKLRKTSNEEKILERKISRVITFIIVIIFSFVFNRQLLAFI